MANDEARPLSATAALTMEQKRAGLRQVPAFAGLSDADVNVLLGCFRWRQLRDGDVLFRQGDYGDSLLVIAAGELAVRVKRGDAEVDIVRIKTGELVGEMACIDPAPRSATLVSCGYTTVAELSRDALHAMRAGAPHLSSLVVGAVIREVTRRLREIESRIDWEFAPVKVAPPEKSVSAAPPRTDAPVSQPPQSSFRRFLEKLRRPT
jgi:signal-transduction protein with cAMP-binding, CBS, and nucleotidyltransferase domain